MTTPRPPRLSALTEDDPTRIGPFDVHGRLGAGGMGVVYGATDARGRWAAVKLIRGEFTDDPEFRGRFTREVALMRRVESRSIAPVIAADTACHGRPWYASAYVAGPTLQERVGGCGALGPGPVQALAVGLAEAIGAIHTAGVVHRDLKPANVVLAAEGPRVLDFGIARALDESAITRTGGVVGSPGWMSPERFRGRTGPEADVFAWGALVAYAATGRAPFGTGTAEELMYRVLNDGPDLDGLPGELAEAVGRALAKDPAARPASAALVPMVAAGYGHVPAAEASETAATIIDRTWASPPASGQAPPPPGSAGPSAPPTGPPDRNRRLAVPPPVPPEGRPRPRTWAVIASVLGSLGLVAGTGLVAPDIITRFSAEEPPGPAPQGSGTVNGAVPETSHPALEQLIEEDTLHLRTAEQPPYSFDDDGWTGIAPEVARSVFEELGVVDVEAEDVYRTHGHEKIQESLLADREADVVALNMAVTPDLCGSVAFSDPFARFRTGFVVRDEDAAELSALSDDGELGFAEIADAGLQLGVQVQGEESGDGLVQEIPHEELALDAGMDPDNMRVGNFADMMAYLGPAGELDVIAVDATTMRWRQDDQRNDFDNFQDFTMIGSFTPEDPDTGAPLMAALAFRPQATGLAAAVNEKLDELRASGDLLSTTEAFGMTEDELPPEHVTAEDICSGG